MRRGLGSAIATAVAAAALTAGVPRTAEAVPTGCYANFDYANLHGWSYCERGSGTHRIFISCVGRDANGNQFGAGFWGPWKKAGEFSEEWCGSDFNNANNYAVETR